MSSNIKLRASSVSYKGLREANEDELDLQMSTDPKLFAIYDGHGGEDVSSFLKKELPSYFKNQKLPIKKSYTYDSFKQLQEKLVKTQPINSQEMGSTCLCALQQNDRLEVFNCGDCRCVIGNNKKSIQITTDHKPNEQHEKQRLSKIKGKEEIYLDDNIWRIGPLSVSRSFGDTDTAPYITSKPDIFTHKLNSGDDFMVLACDGIWDVMSNKEVVDFVYQNPQNTVRKLASHALKLGSTDNISAIIVFFDHEQSNNTIGGSKKKINKTDSSKTGSSKTGGSKTSTSKPSTSKSSSSKPSSSNPSTSKSSSSKPSTSKSSSSKPSSSKPSSSKPSSSKPSSSKPSSSKPSTSKSSSSKPSSSKPSTSKSKKLHPQKVNN